MAECDLQIVDDVLGHREPFIAGIVKGNALSGHAAGYEEILHRRDEIVSCVLSGPAFNPTVLDLEMRTAGGKRIRNSMRTTLGLQRG